MKWLTTWLGEWLAKYLSQPSQQYFLPTTSSPDRLARALRPADVLLVEGNTRISVAIKYLTQSTWSHAALYVGDALGTPAGGGEPHVFIEADLRGGVRSVPLSSYSHLHTRICRPARLTWEDKRKVIAFAVARLGHRYDLRHTLDLARYLLPTPPVPVRWRRRMLALGSSDPTRAICSTLIAGAFNHVRYPILPEITLEKTLDKSQKESIREILHVRDHGLYTPRDFDISPYFEIIKPTLLFGFNYKKVQWGDKLTEQVENGFAHKE